MRGFTDYTRTDLELLHARSAWLGVGLLSFDLAGYGVAVAAVAWQRSWPLQVLFAGLASIFVGRLFMLGHDACHQSLTPSRRLNRALGTIALTVCWHPYSLWDFGHNRIHHRFTNLRDLDYVWEPLTPDEYQRLPAIQRARYRFYRTPVGHFFYYGAEIWWRRMFFPRPSDVGPYTREYIVDHALVVMWMLALSGALLALHAAVVGGLTFAGAAAVLAWGACVPVAFFSLAMSTVIYLHHTHPRVRWARGARQTTSEAQVGGSVHVVLPGFLARTLHHIMDHTAHHARPGIPLYNLPEGQAILEADHDIVITERWTPAFHLSTLRICQLFDLERNQWVSFESRARESPWTRSLKS